VVDFKTWDTEWFDKLDGLEGETVALRFAEVYEDDYDATRKLRPKPGVTEVHEIQQGVGHLEGKAPDTEDQTGLDAVETAPDGGTPTADPSGSTEDTEDVTARELEPKVVTYVRSTQDGLDPGVPESEIVHYLCRETPAEEETVAHAIAKAKERGNITEKTEGHYRV
jgi:hypothetical protein